MENIDAHNLFRCSDTSSVLLGLNKIREVIKRQQKRLPKNEDSDSSSASAVRVHYDLPLRLNMQFRSERRPSVDSDSSQPSLRTKKYPEWIDRAFPQPERRMNASAPRQISRKVANVSAHTKSPSLRSLDGEPLPQWTTPKFVVKKPVPVALRRSTSEGNIRANEVKTSRPLRSRNNEMRSMTNLPREHLNEKILSASTERKRLAKENEDRYEIRNCRADKMSYDVNEVRDFMKKKRAEKKSPSKDNSTHSGKEKSYDVDEIRQYIERKRAKSKERKEEPKTPEKVRNYDRAAVRKFIEEKKSTSPHTTPQKVAERERREKLQKAEQFRAVRRSPHKLPPSEDNARNRRHRDTEPVCEGNLRQYIDELLNNNNNTWGLDEKVRVPQNFLDFNTSLGNVARDLSPLRTSKTTPKPVLAAFDKTVDSVFSDLTNPLENLEQVSGATTPNTTLFESPELSPIRKYGDLDNNQPRDTDTSKAVLNETFMVSEIDSISSDENKKTTPPAQGNQEKIPLPYASIENVVEERKNIENGILNKFAPRDEIVNHVRIELPEADEIFNKVISEVSWEDLFARVFSQANINEDGKPKSSERISPKKPARSPVEVARKKLFSEAQTVQRNVTPPKSPSKSLSPFKLAKALDVFPASLKPHSGSKGLFSFAAKASSDSSSSQSSAINSSRPKNSPQKPFSDKCLLPDEMYAAPTINMSPVSSFSLSENSFSVNSSLLSNRSPMTNEKQSSQPTTPSVSLSVSERVKQIRKERTISPVNLNSSLEINKNSSSAKLNQQDLFRLTPDIDDLDDDVDDVNDDDATDNISSIKSEISPITGVTTFDDDEQNVDKTPNSTPSTSTSSSTTEVEVIHKTSLSKAVTVLEKSCAITPSMVRLMVDDIAKEIHCSRNKSRSWKWLETTSAKNESPEITSYRIFLSDLMKDLISTTFRSKENIPLKSRSIFEVAQFVRKMQFPASAEELSAILWPKVCEMTGIESNCNSKPVLSRDGLVAFWRKSRRRDLVDSIISQDLYDEERKWTCFDDQENVVKESLAGFVFEALLDEIIQNVAQDSLEH